MFSLHCKLRACNLQNSTLRIAYIAFVWLGFTVWEILVFKAVYLKCICEIEYSKSGSESQDQIWWNLVIEVQQMKSDKTKSGRNYADNFFLWVS